MTNRNETGEPQLSPKELLAHGLESLELGEFPEALSHLERLPPTARPANAISAHAICLAKVKGSYRSAVTLCHEAIKKDPKNPEHYFRQGLIFLLAGRKKDAIWVFRLGLRHGRHRGIIEHLGKMGIRRPPPISLLDRTNPLNKYLGLLLTRLRLR
jgi:tetratricopeptide (TPR) repeat protein